MLSSFVKIRSKIEGTFCDLYLVGSFACWYKKLSLKHSRKSVEVWVSFSVEFMLFQPEHLILKSPRIIKCDGFPPDMSRSVSKRFRLFSRVEFGLRSTHPIIMLSPPERLILHQVDSPKFRFCWTSTAGKLF